MPDEHAPYGPSRIPMFLRCPGSVQFCQKVGERRDSMAAAEGTVAHSIVEMCLEVGFEPEDFLGHRLSADGFTFEVDDDMIDFLRPGIEWVQERPGRLVTEYRVDLSRWMPGQFGTLDVGLIGKRNVTIWDLKYGRGVEVAALNHEPTMAYAMAFWDNVARHETDATDFLIHIYQPRIERGGGEFWITLDELLEWGENTLKPGFEAATAEDPPLIPGEKQCQFCDAKSVCPAYAKWAMDMIDLEFDDLDDEEVRLSNAEDFNAERRALIARHAGDIKKWIDAVHGKVADDAFRGLPTPGLKLVSGKKGIRTWADQKAAEKLILKHLDFDKAYGDAPLISPTQVEKLAKKKEIPSTAWTKLQKLVTQPDGKPSLVDEGDERPPLNLTDEFDDYDDPDDS